MKSFLESESQIDMMVEIRLLSCFLITFLPSLRDPTEDSTYCYDYASVELYCNDILQGLLLREVSNPDRALYFGLPIEDRSHMPSLRNGALRVSY